MSFDDLGQDLTSTPVTCQFRSISSLIYDLNNFPAQFGRVTSEVNHFSFHKIRMIGMPCQAWLLYLKFENDNVTCFGTRTVMNYFSFNQDLANTCQILFFTLWDDCTICLVLHAGENKRRETSKAKENQMMLSLHLYNHLYKPKHHDNHFAKHGHLRTPQLERDRKRPGNFPSCQGLLLHVTPWRIHRYHQRGCS